MPIELVVELFAEWVQDWNNEEKRRTEMARGILSYSQVFEKSYSQEQIRKPTDAQLRLCLHRTYKGVTVHEGGLVELNAGRYSQGLTNRYRSEMLFQYIGETVHLRFNPYDLTQVVYAYTDKGEFIGEIPLYADAAFDDLSSARHHNLLQTDTVERAAWLKEQMVDLSNEELVAMTRSDEKPEPLGGMVPSIQEMTPELARTPAQHRMSHTQNSEEFDGLFESQATSKKAVGSDFEPEMDIDAFIESYGRAK